MAPVDRETHRKICPALIVTCTAADVGCTINVQRSKMAKHERGCTLLSSRPILLRLQALEIEVKQLKEENKQLHSRLASLEDLPTLTPNTPKPAPNPKPSPNPASTPNPSLNADDKDASKGVGKGAGKGDGDKDDGKGAAKGPAPVVHAELEKALAGYLKVGKVYKEGGKLKITEKDYNYNMRVRNAVFQVLTPERATEFCCADYDVQLNTCETDEAISKYFEVVKK